MEELTEELVALALELIDEYGAEVIYTPKVSDDYDPATSSATPLDIPPEAIKALIEDYDLQRSGQGFVSGLIRSGDKKFTIAGQALLNAEVGAVLSFSEGAFNIVNIKKFYLSATPVLLEIQGRS